MFLCLATELAKTSCLIERSDLWKVSRRPPYSPPDPQPDPRTPSGRRERELRSRSRNEQQTEHKLTGEEFPEWGVLSCLGDQQVGRLHVLRPGGCGQLSPRVDGPVAGCRPLPLLLPAGSPHRHRPVEGLGLVVSSEQSLGHLLHQVDEEEARADHQHGQELHLEALGLGRQSFGDLWEHVEHRGGEEDSPAKTWEDWRYYRLTSSNNPILQDVFATRRFFDRIMMIFV